MHREMPGFGGYVRKKRAQIMIKNRAKEQKIGNLDRCGLTVLTPAAMGQADRLTIDRGTAGYQLMLAAGKAVADHALGTGARSVLVLAGPGNNGGDGIVAARLLVEAGMEVDVALLGEPGNLKGDAALALNDYGGSVRAFSPGEADAILPDADLVIDALFGAGLARGVTGGLGRLIERVNKSGATVLAIDLPSGVDGASGQISGSAIDADLTVTFFRLKPGHLLFPGRARCGTIHVAQIGIEDSVLAEIGSPLRLNMPALWDVDFPIPDHETHKYKRGHTLVVSGPVLNTGASRLAALAALRVGSGLVTIAGDEEAAKIQAAHLTAVMIRAGNSAEDLTRHLADARINAVVIGPAAGINEGTREKVIACLESAAVVVLDADALTVFGDDPDQLFRRIRARQASVVLTPHSGEFSRLFGPLVADCRTDAAASAAERSGAVVVLKGPDTIVADPTGRISIAANAPPWLATAGSGDVLAGAVGGLLAQKMHAFQAASAAVWLHGEAGCAGGPGLISDDLPDLLRSGLSRIFGRQTPRQI